MGIQLTDFTSVWQGTMVGLSGQDLILSPKNIVCNRMRWTVDIIPPHGCPTGPHGKQGSLTSNGSTAPMHYLIMYLQSLV